MNGIMTERGSKKKRRSAYSSDEEETGSYSPYISEERYRAMLGDHIQKYKRRLNYASQSPSSTRTGTMATKNSVGLKDQKLMNDSRGGLPKFESTSDFLNSNNSQRFGTYPESDFGLQYGAARCAPIPCFRHVDVFLLMYACILTLRNFIGFNFIVLPSIRLSVICDGNYDYDNNCHSIWFIISTKWNSLSG